MPLSASITAYFRACYLAENRASSIVNFFGSSVEQPILIGDPDWLSGKLTELPVPREWGEWAMKRLGIQGKDRELTIGFFFLTKGQGKRYNTPLYLFTGHLARRESFIVLKIDPLSQRVNPAVADLASLEGIERNAWLEQLEQDLPRFPFGFKAEVQLEELLPTVFPDIDLRAWEHFPNTFGQEQWETHQLQFGSGRKWRLLPAVGLGVTKKSNRSKGVLNELEEMSNWHTMNTPLRVLLEGEALIPKNQTTGQPLRVPANLSPAQQKIVAASTLEPLSLVVGPPGTGKSFTIAAMAINAVMRGESVLIASRSNQAVDVIGDKIELDFGFKNRVVRGGRSSYKKEMIQYLEDLLHGLNGRSFSNKRKKHLERELRDVHFRIQQLERSFHKKEKEEVYRGTLLEEPDPNWLARWQIRRLLRQKDKKGTFLRPLEKLSTLWASQIELLQELIEEIFQIRLQAALRTNRSAFVHLIKALKARTSDRKDAYFRKVDFNLLFRALPIWLVNTSDVANVLPMHRRLFDLVILDEASQCDIASSLPILARGQRVVVVGDPKQLRHVSFLAHQKQRQLIEQFKLEDVPYDRLNYRDQSVLDLVSDCLPSQEQVFFLDEHYRSVPDIIAFSNQRFYQDQLRVMTVLKKQEWGRGIEIHPVFGKRLKKGYNPTEADWILTKIKELIATESEAGLPRKWSIGILSPFRDQVEHLRTRLLETFDLDTLDQHRILLGTPFDFQGEERDVMFLSMAVDPHSHPSTWQYLNRADIFNVATTRAKWKQYIVHSLGEEPSGNNHLLTQYIQEAEAGHWTSDSQREKPALDRFANELQDWAETTLGVQAHIDFLLAGTQVDMLLKAGQKTLAIDLVGYPGYFTEAFPLDHYRLLARLGLHCMVVYYSDWLVRPELVEQEIKEQWQRLYGKRNT
ncbi:MAG: DEAD/DEAH box helicase [Bacteroidota bacterium]